MLKALTGDKRYEEIIPEIKNLEKEEGGISMCELLDKYENRGIAKGLSQGISQGITRGIMQGKEESIRNLMETMKWTAEQAMEALKIPVGERDTYLARL